MAEVFDESFIDQLPADPLDALRSIITRYNSHFPNTPQPEQFGLTTQAYALAREYSVAYAPQFAAQLKKVLSPSDKNQATKIVASSFRAVLTMIETEKTSQSFENVDQRAKALIRKVDSIEFTDGDLKRLQTMIDEMRGIATDTNELSERHRSRILERLEKLQAEIHKRVTKLEHAWLLVPEIGLAIGQFGKDAAPMWDRLNETLRIVAGAEARRAEFPSNYEPPFLPSPDFGGDSVDEDSQEPDTKAPE